MKDEDGRPIDIASYNPILDTKIDEVEYADRYKTEMTANNIASNLFAQVDQYENRLVLFDDIIDHRKYGSEIKRNDAFIHTSNCNKSCRKNTKFW